jgi:PAS domain S-box-containing protein
MPDMADPPTRRRVKFARARSVARADGNLLDDGFELSPGLVCVSGTDGLFKKITPAWIDLLRCSASDLIGRRFLDFVHPDDRDATTRLFDRVSAGIEITRFRNRYQRSDGSYRWLMWRARLVAGTELIVASARDVTVRDDMDVHLAALRQALPNLRPDHADLCAMLADELGSPTTVVVGFGQLLERDDLTKDQRDSVEHILSAGQRLLALGERLRQAAKKS